MTRVLAGANYLDPYDTIQSGTVRGPLGPTGPQRNPDMSWTGFSNWARTKGYNNVYAPAGSYEAFAGAGGKDNIYDYGRYLLGTYGVSPSFNIPDVLVNQYMKGQDLASAAPWTTNQPPKGSIGWGTSLPYGMPDFQNIPQRQYNIQSPVTVRNYSDFYNPTARQFNDFYNPIARQFNETYSEAPLDAKDYANKYVAAASEPLVREYKNRLMPEAVAQLNRRGMLGSSPEADQYKRMLEDVTQGPLKDIALEGARRESDLRVQDALRKMGLAREDWTTNLGATRAYNALNDAYNRQDWTTNLNAIRGYNAQNDMYNRQDWLSNLGASRTSQEFADQQKVRDYLLSQGYGIEDARNFADKLYNAWQTQGNWQVGQAGTDQAERDRSTQNALQLQLLDMQIKADAEARRKQQEAAQNANLWGGIGSLAGMFVKPPIPKF